MRYRIRLSLSRDRLCRETRSLAPNQLTRADPSRTFINPINYTYFFIYHVPRDCSPVCQFRSQNNHRQRQLQHGDSSDSWWLRLTEIKQSRSRKSRFSHSPPNQTKQPGLILSSRLLHRLPHLPIRSYTIPQAWTLTPIWKWRPSSPNL